MMDPEEEEGMEAFDISDRDLHFALNPGTARGLSKNQQLYGSSISCYINIYRSNFIGCKFWMTT